VDCNQGLPHPPPDPPQPAEAPVTTHQHTLQKTEVIQKQSNLPRAAPSPLQLPAAAPPPAKANLAQYF
jgi:hypothetical protein